MFKVTKNNLSGQMLELIIELPTEELLSYLDKAAQKLSQAKPPAGFRPGKVDRETALKIYGAMALYEASLDFVVRDTFPKAIKQEKIEFIGEPQIAVVKCAPGNPIVYKAKLNLKPTVKLGNYESFKVERKKIDIIELEVNRVLEELRDSRASEVRVSRPAQVGDRVVLDVSLFLDKVPLDGGQFKKQHFILGKDDFWEGFSKKIIGLKADQELEFYLDIPKNHPQKNMAGKKIDFKVRAQDIFERTIPQPDDAFAESLGGFKTIIDFKSTIKDNLTKEAEAKEEQRLAGEVLHNLVKQSVFSDIPELLIVNEQQMMLAETRDMITRQGFKWPDYLGHLKKTEEDIVSGFKESALDRIKKNLVLSQLVKEKNIQVTDDEIESEWRLALSANPALAPIAATDEAKSRAIKLHLKSVLQNRKVLKTLLPV